MLFKYSNNRYYLADDEIKRLANVGLITKSFKSDYYSPSFINGYNSCPFGQLLKSLSSEKFIEQLEIGSCVHYLLEKVFANGVISEYDKKHVNDKLLNNRALIDKAYAYYNAYFKIKDDYYDYKSFTEYELKEVAPKSADVFRNFSADSVPKFKGVIDRVDIAKNRIRILDYKTASRQIGSDQYIDQLIIYKWMFEEEFGAEVDDLCIVSLYIEEPKLIYPSISMVAQSKLVEKVVNTDVNVKASMESNSYEIRQSYNCRYCKFCDQCKKREDISLAVDKEKEEV